MEYKDEFELARLISRKMLGLLAAEEERGLADWVNTSAEHQKLYDKMLAGTSFQAREKLEVGINLDIVCKKIEGKIKSSVFRKRIWRAASVAAIVVCGVITTWIWTDLNTPQESSVKVAATIKPGSTKAILTLYNGEQKTLTGNEKAEELQQRGVISRTMNQKPEDCYNKIEVPRGGEYRLVLADGTKIWLNAESVFEYPLTFNTKRRTVKLSGEAYFEVAPDTTCPFEIFTNDNISVKVLGTTFNVHSYPEQPDILITLVEGTVAVGYNRKETRLRPNQQAIFDRAGGKLSVRDVQDARSYCSWKNGMFIFDGESLELILEALAKWYDVQIVYDGIEPASLGHFSVNIDRCDSFIPILTMLKQITGLDYRIEGKKVYLSILK